MDALRIVHITGSKGKGSTASFVESIFRQHGLRTALYTSPHLVHPRERLRLNGRCMGLVSFSEAVIDLYNRLYGWEGPVPGLFRFMTLLAYDRMLMLKQADALDVAIVEVGMGGRYDATNVVEMPAVTAITSLSLEHVRPLGPTLADIAYHKVGIAKKGIPLVSVPQPIEAVEVICNSAAETGAPLEFVESLDRELDGKSVNLGIIGDHQRLNAALAVRIAQHWFKKYSYQSCLDMTRTALEKTFWPGRHQKVKRGCRAWYLDGAHTIESVQYALDWFNNCKSSNRQTVLLFHVSHDRSFVKLLEPVSRHKFDRIYFVKPFSSTDTEIERNDLSLHKQMAQYWLELTDQPSFYMTVEEFFSTLEDQPRQLDILVIGSLYLVGDIMRLIDAPIDNY